MIRGTTPKHVFTLPFSTSTIQTVEITYVQDDAVVLQKGNDECTLSGNTVTVKLTQEDTYKFSESGYVKVQVRVLTKDGDALASSIERVRCIDCLSDEVLT